MVRLVPSDFTTVANCLTRTRAGGYTTVVDRYSSEDFNQMKRMLIVPFALLFLASVAAANPLCADEVTLTTYIANYQGSANACQIGDKLFYNFGYGSSTDGIPASGSAGAVLVQIAPAPGDGITNPGLIFGSLPFSVTAGHSMDGTITYDVATLSGSALMEDYGIVIAGSHTDIGTGQAFGTVTESFSNIATQLVTGFGPLTAHVNSAEVAFTPFISGALVTTQIHVQSPAGGGDFVSISLVRENFSEIIPEPYEAVLIGSGLVLLGLRRIRVKRGV